MTNLRRSSSDKSTTPLRAARQRNTHARTTPWKTAITMGVVVLFAVTACASGSQKSSSSGEASLRLSTWGNDTRLGLTKQAVAAFMKANPKIKVTIENSEWTSYWDKLATTTAANDAPDVIQMDESYIAAYGSRGALLDLKKVKDTIDLSGMSSTVLDTGKVSGVLVGAPVGLANYAIGVNPKILKDAGLEMPDDVTWTWDDLAKLAAAVTAKLGAQGIYGLDQFGTNPAELSFWARQRGEELWPRQGQTPITAATITSYFDYAAKLIKMRATPPASVQVENVTGTQDANPFSTNKAAFHPLYNTQISSFGASSGDKLQLLRLPAQETGKSAGLVNKASMYWSISARTSQSEAAAKLVSFLLTDPAATKVLGTERGIPAIASVQDAIAPQLDPQATVALKYNQAVTRDLVSPPQVTPAKASGFGSEFQNVSTEAMFDRTSSTDAAKKTLSIMESMK